MHGHKLVLAKTVLIFVSPGCVKVGKPLIIRDDSNNYSSHLDNSGLPTA